jgi:hypothetical protein
MKKQKNLLATNEGIGDEEEKKKKRETTGKQRKEGR